MAARDLYLTSGRREAQIWNPIIEWPVEQVWQTLDDAGLETHQAYL